MIISYVGGLKHVDNYKTIMKSVNTLKEMLSDAVQRGVTIDAKMIDIA
jgi:hypothetical protein